MSRDTVTIGADPEIFIADTRTGAVVPVVGLLGGSKDAPKPMVGMGDGFAVQEDNVMAEYNIPPCNGEKQFVQYIHSGLAHVRKLITKKNNNYDAVAGHSFLFGAHLLDTPEAKTFGCSPDFNAHSNGEKRKPFSPTVLVDGKGGEWRFAGGHVHIGFDKKAFNDVPDFVIAMFADVFLGLPSVAVDKQGKRRKLYGNAGTYRPTAYGIEYRVLSNFWVFDRQYTFDIARKAFNLGFWVANTSTDKLQTLLSELPWADVETAINDEDAPLASNLLEYIASKNVGIQQ